jgi:hypothetical protein
MDIYNFLWFVTGCGAGYAITLVLIAVMTAGRQASHVMPYEDWPDE